MTSLSETYLSCKSAFANKLTNKGVSATSNDGLTTLINKIDNIPSGIHDNSLNLFADKKIDQSSNTINLYALLLRDGIAKAGETVNFYIDGDGTTYDSKVLTANTATTVSDRYSIDLPSTVTGYVYLEASKNILILYVNGSSSTDLTIYPTGGSPTIIYDVVSLVYANGVLTVTEDDDTVTEIDCSSYDMSSVTSTVTGVVIKDYGAKSATTNSGGIATIPYLCNGSGEHIVKAISGSVVSETYTVWDTLFYCKGLDGTGNHNPNWFESAPSTMTVTRSSNGTTISKTGNGNVLPSTQPTESSSWSTLLKLGVPLTVEFEIVEGSGLSFRCYNNSNQSVFDKGLSSGLWKFEITSNSAKCYKNGVEQTLTASNFENTVYFAFTGSGSTEASITFKDFKIYSS